MDFYPDYDPLYEGLPVFLEEIEHYVIDNIGKGISLYSHPPDSMLNDQERLPHKLGLKFDIREVFNHWENNSCMQQSEGILLRMHDKSEQIISLVKSPEYDYYFRIQKIEQNPNGAVNVRDISVLDQKVLAQDSIRQGSALLIKTKFDGTIAVMDLYANGDICPLGYMEKPPRLSPNRIFNRSTFCT